MLESDEMSRRKSIVLTRRLSEQTSVHFRLRKPFCRHTFLLLLWLCPDLASSDLKPSLPPIVKDSPFLVAWNAPTARCSAPYGVPLNLDSYNILVNSQEAFLGGNITIFYHDRLGLYPFYLDSIVPPTAVNGGCPQNGSLTNHLDKMKKDIARVMPSASFSGLSVIDWEEWRPLWIRNWGKKSIYRNMSLQLVRQRNPDLSEDEVKIKARWEYETAAKDFMSKTLRLARSLRPRGWWGYYLFPDCYNYHYLHDFESYSGHCPPLEVQRNNELKWLWEQSKALYPSIYMEEVLRSSMQGKKFVWAKLGEALRVAELSSRQHSLPVFVYARAFYTHTLKELTQTNCMKIQGYLMRTLGPYIVNVTMAAKLCSKFICNNCGRCIRRRMDSDTYLHLSSHSFQIRANRDGNRTWLSVTGALGDQQKDKLKREFTCHCYQGWKGENCCPPSQGKGMKLRTWDWCIAGIALLTLLVWNL